MKQTFRGGRVVSLKRADRRWVVGHNGCQTTHTTFADAFAAALREVCDG
jgi:hypothetical protein